MKIAIIGGGKRCRAFLEMFDSRRFPKLGAEIVAVADPDLEASGMRLAREKNILVTTHYEDFYEIKDLDLVIELTGKADLLEDFQRRKPAGVRVLESAISRIFADLLSLREEIQFAKCQINLVEGIMDSLFMGLRDWVLVMQPDMKLLDANEAFLAAVGMSKDDVVGKFCHEAAYGSPTRCSREGFCCPVARCIETGDVAHAIQEGGGGPGLGRYQEITAVPLKTAGGRIELVVEIIRDITDEMETKVEQKVSALKEDLMRLVYEEKMISLGKMAASAVHEINNPLTGINALARLVRRELESGQTDAAARERFIYYLGLIDSESARCSGIVRDLLHFSRQSKGIRSKFQVNELIERVLDFVRFRLDSQQIRVKTELAPELPAITGDPSQIEQCLLNLIFNAADAMDEGGELVLRTSRVRHQPPMIRVEVIDNGTGIPKETVPFIFEPFFSTKCHDKGVGLGLSVVYGIVKEHGGTVYVKTKEGAGSRFILKFPVERGSREECGYVRNDTNSCCR
ncbi:MAG: ATP-binding protein [Syntrophobacteraceae bacterium]|nr:ATP-binding protein [Syntrophobacteraceae bacterium]